jgi:uncharacterized protein YecE (DUF72 family)
MRLHVGTDSLRGDITGYARRFDLLELSAERGRLPRVQRLADMRRAVGDEFVFSVRLPRTLAEQEPGAERDAALAYAGEVVRALRADLVVLQTPPSVRPSPRNRRRLQELAERLTPLAKLAWEPRGLWEAEDSESFARELSAVLVRDVSREDAPSGPELYTRIRALGRSGVSLDALGRAAEAALPCDVAWVVIEGDGAARAASSLRRLVAEAAEYAAEAEDGDDDELGDVAGDEELDDDEALDDGAEDDDGDDEAEVP